jgi:hypothetical protein
VAELQPGSTSTVARLSVQAGSSVSRVDTAPP